MYNAQATHDGPGSLGTTRLHMDVADAVNIMTHACATPEGRPGYATWDIFRAEDASALRAFLRARFCVPTHEDPIHRQCFYLDCEMRQELARKYGVWSHRIYQTPGEAVFIPAGCAHQVCVCVWILAAFC
jgi:[histone H3]-dimethyl-L-lysine9 demethylase